MKRIIYLFMMCVWVPGVGQAQWLDDIVYFNNASADHGFPATAKLVNSADGSLYRLAFTLSTAVFDVAGNAQSAEAGRAYLIKYNADFEVVYALPLPLFSFFGFDGYEPFTGLDVDEEGHVYVGGNTRSSTDFNPFGEAQVVALPDFGSAAFLAKYSPDGELLWLHVDEGTSTPHSTINAVYAKPGGGCYAGLLGGPVSFADAEWSSEGEDPWHDAGILSFDGEGQLLWRHSFDESDRAKSVTAMQESTGGRLTYGVNSSNGLWGDELHLGQLDANGALLWTRHISTSDWTLGHFSNIASIIAADEKLYIAGSLKGWSTFGTVNGEEVNPTAHFVDGFVASYELSDGELRWADLIHNPEGKVWCNGLVMREGKLLAAGFTQGNFKFGLEGELVESVFSDQNVFLTSIAPETGSFEYYQMLAKATELQAVGYDALQDNLYISGTYTSGWPLEAGTELPGHTATGGIHVRYTLNTALNTQNDQNGIELVLYPNPATDYINYTLPATPAPGDRIAVYNLTGQRIMELAADGAPLRTAHLPKGIYLMQWTPARGEARTAKFIKQ